MKQPFVSPTVTLIRFGQEEILLSSLDIGPWTPADAHVRDRDHERE